MGKQATVIPFKRTKEFPPCAYWDFDTETPCARPAGWVYRNRSRVSYVCGRCRKALLSIAPMFQRFFEVMQ